jgi:hypothetical protein
MGNNGSNLAPGCTTCSQGGSSFGNYSNISSFGKIRNKNKYYKDHIVKSDSKGRYIIIKGKKKYLPKGARTTSKKDKKQKKVKKPKGYYLRKKVKSPGRKIVRTKKGKKVGRRLSARTIFNQQGKKALGKTFNILQKDGKYKIKVLRLRKNGSPYFATKFGESKHHLNFNLDKRIPLGPKFDDMTGYKLSYPDYKQDIPPSGVRQPKPMSFLPKVAHTHFGRMCFGA